ncbi:MAG: glycoside hydrolase family 57 protein [Pseudomonadota bacterium]
MTVTKKLNLILCWHMHQPDYRHHATGEFALPWTYLHAIKDYTDMAFHVESHRQAKAVFNFVPVLLDQLEDYARQFSENKIRDPLLKLLTVKNLDTLPEKQHKFILDSCFRSNHSKMIQPYPAYKRLYDLFKLHDEHGAGHLGYFSGQYLGDLLVWYHLVWMGESVRRESELVAGLMTKGCHFTPEDRQRLFGLIGELIREVIPRYKKLAQAGQIELSTTPYYHPISPLLLDFDSARESVPGTSLPVSTAYPGGESRVKFHVGAAAESHQRRFGERPQGMWPAEGGISQAFAVLLAKQGCRWAATGEGVLVNSLRKAQPDQPLPDKSAYLYRPYRVADGAHEIMCFFRDDRLSDLIGFEYAKWFGKDAVSNFVHALEEIWRQSPDHESPVVSVILDGENAWEYYPYNGYYFLSELYGALEEHPFIQMTTFKDYLDSCQSNQRHLQLGIAENANASCAVPGELPYLVAGSWVYGNFTTWIGSPEKNRAWDLLCQAKQSFDLVMASGRLSEEQKSLAAEQLAVCEGSDWFWWFGDYNPAESVASFDRLYRENLVDLYHLLQLPVPEALNHPISTGGGHPEAGGAMRRAS